MGFLAVNFIVAFRYFGGLRVERPCRKSILLVVYDNHRQRRIPNASFFISLAICVASDRLIFRQLPR